MTSHELAKKLLEGPDLTVITYGFSQESESCECTEVEEDKTGDRFTDKNGHYVQRPHILLS